MDLEARHLRIICAISDTGSLTRAAVTLGITQPALTHQLQRIERMLGGSLFVRDRRGTQPTALGELVLSRARVILPSMAELVREARLLHERATGEPQLIRLANHPTPVSAPIIERLRELRPTAEISMRAERSGHNAVELVASGALELAILLEHPVLPLPRPHGVTVHEIVTAPMFVALAAGHPLAANDEVNLVDLADEHWILPDELEIRCAEFLRDCCEQVGVTPHIAYRLTSHVCRDLIRRGLGICLVQATFVEGDGIAVRPIKGPPLELRQILAVRADGPVAGYGRPLAAAARSAYWTCAELSAIYQSWLAAHADRGFRVPEPRESHGQTQQPV